MVFQKGIDAMKIRQMGKKILIVLLLSSFVLLTVFCNLPYCYPAYPGTPEWENLDGIGMSLAHDVPDFRIRLMSTSALLYTFLDHYMLFIPLANLYPLDPTYWLGKGGSTENDELYPMVQELLSRPDAGEVLFRAYQLIPLYSSDDDLLNIDKLIWLEFLLTLPSVKNQFSENEKAEIDTVAEIKIRERVKAGIENPSWLCQYYTETYTPGHWHEFIVGEYVPAQWNRKKVKEVLDRFR